MLHKSCGMKNSCLYNLPLLCSSFTSHPTQFVTDTISIVNIQEQSTRQIVSALCMAQVHSPKGLLSLPNKCCRFLLKLKNQLKPSLGGQWKYICTDVKEDTLSIEQFLLVVTVISSIPHIASLPVEFHKHTGAHVVAVYATGCNGRWQCYGDCWEGLCQSCAHTNFLLSQEPCSLLDDMQTGWTSTVHHYIRGDLGGEDRTVSLRIENADGSSRSASSSILACFQMKFL